jgi:hypothetical protein
MLFSRPLHPASPQARGSSCSRRAPPTGVRPSARASLPTFAPPRSVLAIIVRPPDHTVAQTCLLGSHLPAGTLHLTSHLRFGQPNSYLHKGIPGQMASFGLPLECVFGRHGGRMASAAGQRNRSMRTTRLISRFFVVASPSLRGVDVWSQRYDGVSHALARPGTSVFIDDHASITAVVTPVAMPV